ncbi:hypothetical protein ABID19_006779 [Mesorhizobium robiniae]|uniref:Uncharacterized protein n=1 Tax=Mesorhizobium robiniae TaxID=559315 RepID=A0ABV2GZK8_9HYPH
MNLVQTDIAGAMIQYLLVAEATFYPSGLFLLAIREWPRAPEKWIHIR